ncbi:MAG: NAD-dependent epimerase/dehydratase family protein [Anaerolineales bacterium]|nr:NAD-dependent epimerase/dehydratase family protein [Anaerolineales bacterium]
MKACVIGGCGFIGSHLVDGLLVDGWQVIVFDRVMERYRAPLPGVEYILGELGNKGLLGTILRGVDVVFHLVSTTVPQSSNESPVFDIQSNLIDTIGLLDACVACGVKKVIFFSSGGTVYGIPRAVPVSEDHPTEPISSYGIVKLAIEKYLHLYNRLYSLPYTILRPSNPFGVRQNPSGQQGAVAVFLGRVAQGLPIVVWGDGEIVRDYIEIHDLVRAAILSAETTAKSQVFNIGSGQGTSINTLIDIIRSVVDKPVAKMHLPARPFDVPSVVLDISRAQAELKWKPQASLEDGITRTWEWTKSVE